LRVLIVDDDAAFRRWSSLALSEAGVEDVAVPTVTEAREALEKAKDRPFDVILLDVELPGTKGFEFLEQLRAEGNQIPVVFSTVHETLEERVHGLDLGADDYLVKPVEFSELVARLRAVLRRSLRTRKMKLGDFVLDLDARRVEREGRPIFLSPREFDLLWVLIQARGRPVSREELLRRMWGGIVYGQSNVVEVHVSRLRRKLERAGGPTIETVHGSGYRVSI
jgi:DNA-binding response OmpR family regulator